jgi:glycosyltransferase involved in cell wall biosynthesis
LRIIQAAGWYFPDSVGGTEVYVSSLARLFRAAGHEVRVAVPEPGGRSARSYVHEQCEVFRYPVPLRPTRDEAQSRAPARGAEVFHRWLAEARADIVHVHTFVTGLGLHEVRAAHEAGARTIVTTHASSLGFVCQRGTLMWRGVSICDGLVQRERCAKCALEQRGANRTVAGLVSRLPAAVSRCTGVIPGPIGTALGMGELISSNQQRQRELLQLVDRFVVLTRRAAEIVIANGGAAEKVGVNRLGVSQDANVADGPRRANWPMRIGYVGRFDPVKGVYDLAEAIHKLSVDTPLRFEFRGPSSTDGDRAVRRDLEIRFAGDARVAFGEPVAPAQIPVLMRSYDLLCCPSRCLEGGPTTGLEALAAGTPVIAASVGGVAEVIEDGVSGRLVPAGDVNALASTLAEIAADPVSTVGRWRSHIVHPRTMREVAADYLKLYVCDN